MTSSVPRREKTPQQLREYGEVMTLAALIFSALGIWKHHGISLSVFILLTIACGFLTAAFFSPESLRGIEKKWMLFSEKIGVVATFLIMGVTFYLVITPFGLLMRLFGKDLLSRKLDRGRESYWENADHEGSGSRHYLPY
jgi:hypothetical protein